MNQSDEPLTVAQLDLLDIHANSRMDKMFYRTLQRQHAAHMNDTFGTRQQPPIRTTAARDRQDRNLKRQARLAAKEK